MKNKLPLIAAVIVAIAAVVIIRLYIKGEEEKNAALSRGKRVAVAKIDIKAGTTLQAGMLTVKEVPERYLPPRHVTDTPDNVKIVFGMKTLMPIKEGQVLQWTDLDSGPPVGFESVIPMGERAFTIRMSGGIKGGLVQPGDHVDILVNFAIPEAKGVKPADKPELTWRARSEIVNIVLLLKAPPLKVTP